MRTRGVATLTVASGCIAALVAACGDASQSPTSRAPATPASSARPLGVALPMCGTDAFTGRLGGTSVVNGSASRQLVLTYTGRWPCTMLPSPASAVGLDASGRQQAIEINTALSQPMGSAVIELRRGQSVGMQVISALPSACHAPVTTVAYTAIAVGINGGYDRYLPVKYTGQNMVLVDFPSGRPLQVDVCGSVVEAAGFQRP